MKKTKIMLENDLLESEIRYKRLQVKDLRLRDEFTKVLEDKYPPYDPYFNAKTRLSLEWESIFFKVGELNSDANYSILLEQKKRLENILHERELKDKEEDEKIDT